MSRLVYKIGLASDKSCAWLEMTLDGKSLGQGALTAADCDELIFGLARARADLSDRVPEELDPGAAPVTIYNPKWRIEQTADPRGRSLDIRHPGFGWCRYVFPEDQAAQMADQMMHGQRT